MDHSGKAKNGGMKRVIDGMIRQTDSPSCGICAARKALREGEVEEKVGGGRTYRRCRSCRQLYLNGKRSVRKVDRTGRTHNSASETHIRLNKYVNRVNDTHI